MSSRPPDVGKRDDQMTMHPPLGEHLSIVSKSIPGQHSEFKCREHFFPGTPPRASFLQSPFPLFLFLDAPLAPVLFAPNIKAHLPSEEGKLKTFEGLSPESQTQSLAQGVGELGRILQSSSASDFFSGALPLCGVVAVNDIPYGIYAPSPSSPHQEGSRIPSNCQRSPCPAPLI